MSGFSNEWLNASMVRREASVMNSPYSASRTRSFASLSAWTALVRCVIQVVTMVAAAPTRDPQAAAIAVMMVEFMDSGTGVEEQNGSAHSGSSSCFDWHCHADEQKRPHHHSIAVRRRRQRAAMLAAASTEDGERR